MTIKINSMVKHANPIKARYSDYHMHEHKESLGSSLEGNNENIQSNWTEDDTLCVDKLSPNFSHTFLLAAENREQSYTY